MIQNIANWYDRMTDTGKEIINRSMIAIGLLLIFGPLIYAISNMPDTASYFSCIQNNQVLLKESISSGTYFKEYPCEKYLPNQ